MSLDAIKEVTAAEERAKSDCAAARKKAEADILKAEAAGRKAVQDSAEKAEAECAELLRQTEAEAADSAARLFESTANKCAIIRAHAESRFDKAAAFIAGRIVKS